jgi:hypothetical protein
MLSQARFIGVAKQMKRRDVNRMLRQSGCVIKNDDGPHTTWQCPCGQHTADIPRHVNISPGVIRDTINRMQCLERGWLQ